MTNVAILDRPATASTPMRRTHPARPMRPARRDVFDLLSAALASFGTHPGRRAAWQGAAGAAEQWRYQTGPADLDIWCDDAAHAQLVDLLTGLNAARIQHADDPARLRHTSYAIETNDGLAVVDLTTGNLSVGPVLLVPDSEIRTIDTPTGPRLARVAAAADLFVRPLLRGRIVDGARLTEARAAWSLTGRHERETFLDRMRSQLGRSVATGIATTLDGSTPPPALAKKARTALVRASLRPRALPATWRQRHTILPARGRAGVLGLSTRGALVVLVGTDGSGKSTVAAEIDARLQGVEITTTSVYMGMARGNLPGVSLARKLLGVAPAGDSAPATSPNRTSASATDHSLVRRAAAWYYAVEYGYRWWRDIRPGMKNGGVVIADRYVYDLRESPWPSSRAAKVAEFFMPRPDVLVLPDAPDRLIHARKPERPATEQAAQQERFRDLVAADPAGTASLTVDTSGMNPAHRDPVSPVIAAVVASMHRMH